MYRTGMASVLLRKINLVMPVSLTSVLSRERARRRTTRYASFTLPLLVWVLLSASISVFAQVPPAPLQSAAPQKNSATENGVLTDDGHMRVQVAAQQQTSLSAELAATIASMPFKEGDSFRAGQALVVFDCSIFKAQLDRAQALAQAAEKTLQVNRRLAELNSISKLDVELAEAKLMETQAEAAAMRVTVSKCTLEAPFSGRVAKVSVDAHQYVPQGKPLLDIVDTRRPEVKLIVPSHWLTWLKKGTHFKVHVDDLNRDFTAHVTRVGARIDPVSQSVSLSGEIEGASSELLPGMSGWAAFNPPK